MTGVPPRAARSGPGFEEQVWEIAKLVPPGRVVAYGDIAALFEVNPRMVGRAMSHCDDPEVPWWRVTNAAGRLGEELLDRAPSHWRSEGTPCRADGAGVHMGRARADLARFAADAQRVVADLPGLR